MKTFFEVCVSDSFPPLFEISIQQSYVRLLEELSVTWSTSLHMSILCAVQDMSDCWTRIAGQKKYFCRTCHDTLPLSPASTWNP